MGERSQSAPALRRVMRGREYFTLAFGSIVGVGWMLVLQDWFERGGPVGAMLGFLVGGIALTPVVCIYGKLAASIPDAATEVAYTAAVFPRSVSFATGWAMAFATAIVCPFEAVSMGLVAAYAFPGMNSIELYRVGDYPVYLPHLVLGLATTCAITAINLCGIRYSTVLQNLTTFGLLSIFAVFATLGLMQGRVENLPPYFAGNDTIRGALASVLAVLRIVPYYMMGFETIPKCSEEAAQGFEPTRFTRVMFWAVGVATFFYVMVVGVVALLQPWPSLLQERFPTAVACERAFGWPWLVQLIMLGVVLSLVKVFNGTFLASTRLLFAMGRRNLLGGGLGAIHPQHQTPYVAIALVGSLTFAGTFLGKSLLVPISDVGSFCGAGVWLATSLAYCRGAAGTRTATSLSLGTVGAIIAGLMMANTAADFGLQHWLALGVWAAVGLTLWKARARNT